MAGLVVCSSVVCSVAVSVCGVNVRRSVTVLVQGEEVRCLSASVSLVVGVLSFSVRGDVKSGEVSICNTYVWSSVVGIGVSDRDRIGGDLEVEEMGTKCVAEEDDRLVHI